MGHLVHWNCTQKIRALSQQTQLTRHDRATRRLDIVSLREVVCAQNRSLKMWTISLAKVGHDGNSAGMGRKNWLGCQHLKVLGFGRIRVPSSATYPLVVLRMVWLRSRHHFWWMKSHIHSYSLKFIGQITSIPSWIGIIDKSPWLVANSCYVVPMFAFEWANLHCFIHVRSHMCEYVVVSTKFTAKSIYPHSSSLCNSLYHKWWTHWRLYMSHSRYSWCLLLQVDSITWFNQDI